MNLLKRAAKEAQQGGAAPQTGAQGPQAPSGAPLGSAGAAGSTLGSSPPLQLSTAGGFAQRTLMGGRNSAFRSLVPAMAPSLGMGPLSPHSGYDSSDSEEINVHEYDEDVSDYENKMRSLRQQMEEEERASRRPSVDSDSDVDVDSNPLSVANLTRNPDSGQPLQLTKHDRERD